MGKIHDYRLVLFCLTIMFICFIHKYVQQIALLSQILVPKLECGRAQI